MSSILFLSLSGERGWSKTEELWSRSAQYLSDDGHEVNCLVFDPPVKNERFKNFGQSHCKLLYLPNKGFKKKNLFDRITYEVSKMRLKKLISDFDFREFDHVILNVNSLHFSEGPFAELYSKFKNYSIIFQVSHADQYIKPSDLKLIRKWIMNAKTNLFLSERIKTAVENKLSMLIENSDVFINPLQVERLSEFPEFVKQAHYIFTMYAPLNISVYGQDKLIKLFETPKWRQRNFVLNIYGMGRDAEELQNILDRKCLNNKIVLQGIPEDFQKVLEKTHLFFQITNEEQIHCPIKDAIAIGRPVVASNKGNCGKWIRNRVNGFLINRCSMDEIEAVMEMVWKERNNWEDMGRKSFDLFNERFPKNVEKKLLLQLGLLKEEKKVKLKLAKTG